MADSSSSTGAAPRRLLPKRHNRLGWAIVTVHHSAFPNYDLEAASRGLDDSARRRELEIDWEATSGKAVYPSFNRQIHVAKQPVPFNPLLPLHIGLDLPGTPAAAITQLNEYQSWIIYPPVTVKESEALGVYEFGERLAEHLLWEYAQPFGLELDDLQLVFVGDPAGFNKISRTGLRKQETRAAFDVLRAGSRIYLGDDDRGEAVHEERPGWGWRVQRGAIEIVTRLEAVKNRLSTLLPDGHPALIVDPRADQIISMFLGGYHYPEYEDGSFGREPDKNHASHLADSLAYVATRLNARPIPPDRPSDAENERPAFVSRAASGRY